MTSSQLTLEAAQNAILAGKAFVTFLNTQTQKRFTYRITQIKDRATGEKLQRWFVSVLTGSNNESSYRYIGWINNNFVFKHTATSKINASAQSVKAFENVFGRIVNQQPHDFLQIWHEGKCLCCGKKLTVPSSIQSGLGPICASVQYIRASRFTPVVNKVA